MQLSEQLSKAKESGKVPKLIVYNRIDGPGSSLDLRLFQQSMWSLAKIPENIDADPTLAWSKELPRTVGVTIDVGSEIEAHPLEPGQIGVESVDFGFSYIFEVGKVPPVKENWLLRVMEAFGLDGVKFVIKNQFPELKSAGLGGSAAVTTGTALLANNLTGNRFSKFQIVGMSSMIEQDLGVSLTGTQEQSCAIFGGVRDYLWFPWGIPGKKSFYGASLRQEILKPEDYPELRKRFDVYFALSRHSKDVNKKWYEEMENINGFMLHKQKCNLAYRFREAIRTKNWDLISEPMERYRQIRTELCVDYMSDASKDILETARQHNAVCFPLGGGGGSILVYSPDPENLPKIREILQKRYKLIDYNIIPEGHKVFNIE